MMNKMKLQKFMPKVVIAFMVLSIVIFLLITTTIGKFASDTHKNINENSNLVGEKIVLNGDTLMITNYNLLTNDYDLENGVTVSVKLANKLEIMKLYPTHKDEIRHQIITRQRIITIDVENRSLFDYYYLQTPIHQLFNTVDENGEKYIAYGIYNNSDELLGVTFASLDWKNMVSSNMGLYNFTPNNANIIVGLALIKMWSILSKLGFRVVEWYAINPKAINNYKKFTDKYNGDWMKIPNSYYHNNQYYDKYRFYIDLTTVKPIQNNKEEILNKYLSGEFI